MTPLEALKRVTEFTREHIASKLSMRKEFRNDGDIMDSSIEVREYVNPAVCYGTIPHKNFQPLDFQCPMILWTFDQVSDNGTYDEGRTVNLRAYVSAYSSELYADDHYLPDNKAVVDLMNALETMYVEISRHHTLNGVGRLKSIDYGIYDGVYYPYAFGWLTFTAEIERMQYADEIDLDTLFKEEI